MLIHRHILPYAGIALTLALAGVASAGTITWNGNAGTGAWGTSGNWDLGHPPMDGDDVVIPNVGVAATVTYSTGTVNLNSLAASKPLTISGGVFNLAAASSTNADFTISAGTRGGAGTLTVAGLFTWSGGTLDGGGTTTCNGGMSLAGSDKILRSHILENAGNATWTSGNFQWGQGGILRNLSAGVFDIQGNPIGVYNQGGTYVTIENAGTFKKTSGAGATSLAANLINTGTAQGNSGVLSFGGNTTNDSSGSFSATAGNSVGFTMNSGTAVQNITGAISGAGTFFVNNGTVNVNAGASFAPDGTSMSGGMLNLNIDGTTGTLAVAPNGGRGGTGTLTCSGLFTWSGGIMEGGGKTICNAGMTWNNQDKLFRNHILENAGPATWTSGNLQLGLGGTFNNLAAGVFDIQGNPIGVFNQGGTILTINNSGVFKKTSGGATTSIVANLNNTGDVQGNSGILSFNGNATQNSSGTFSATAGNSVGFTMTGGTTHNITGTINGAGTFFVNGGTVSVNTGATYAPAATSMAGGTLALNIDGTTATLAIASGGRAGSGTLTVSGLFTWTGGTLDGGGRTVANGGMTWSTGDRLFRDHTLDNNGPATWIGGNMQGGQGGVLNNLANGVFDVQGAFLWVLNQGGAANSINNSGTFKKTAGAGTLTLNLSAFNNAQSVVCSAGTLNIGAPYTQTAGSTILDNANFQSNNTINIQAGILGGVGTVIGNVNNAGTARPGASPGILTITGNFTQTASGTLDIEIGGPTVSTQYDRLVVSGVANLAGTLRLRLANGYVPPLATTFVIVTYASHVGIFDLYNAECFATGQFDVIYNPTNLALVIKQPTQGDLNCDCVLSTIDSDYMKIALINPAAFPGCDIQRADFDGNGTIDGRDIQGFTAQISP